MNKIQTEAPWDIIGWSPERVQAIYREWGLYYTKKHKLYVADYYYDKSLELSPTDSNALYFRSQCKRTIAKTDQALTDAWQALNLDPLRQPFNLEVCDGVYQMNQFEKCDVLLHNFSRKFIGAKIHAFHARLDVVEENFKSSIGDSLGHFAMHNKRALFMAHERIEKMKNVDTRPLWKILRDQGKCDVLSIPEAEVPKLCPREIARRFREFRVYNQMYLGRSWIDVMFLRSLRTNEQLLLEQSKYSSKIMELLTKAKYLAVLKFLKMLQCRSPLYDLKDKAFPNKRLKKEMTEAFLFHIQYDTHRAMIKMLKTMHIMRMEGRLRRLRNYVEQVMGKFVAVKTISVMPWRFEFINEIYNLFALALVDNLLDVPKSLADIPVSDRLRILLKLPNEVIEKPVPLEFGNRATYPNMEAADRTSSQYRAIEERLEERLFFARYPIEKAYIYHELSNVNLIQFRLDKCCLLAEKCITEAKSIQSNVWMFLGVMMLCKAHAMLKKLFKIRNALRVARKIISRMKGEKQLARFVRRSIQVNRAAIIIKRAEDRQRRNKSKLQYQNRSTDNIKQ